MAIRFRCCNPSCRSALQAPDTAAGRQVRCRACGTPQRVPAGDALSIRLEPGPETTAAVQRQVEQEPQFQSAGVVRCEECGRHYVATEALCPDCGRVNLGRLSPLAPEDRQEESRSLPWVLEYVLCPVFGLTNLRSMLILSGVMLVDLAPLGALPLHAIAIQTGMASPLGGFLPGGFFLLTSIGGFLVQAAVAGYVLQFYLTTAHGAILGVNRAPDAPDFSWHDLWTHGVRAIGVFVVYVLPVVTLPLLPLGLLALAEGDDDQAFDLRWIIRAALRRPLAVLELLLVPAVWAVAMVLVIESLGRVAFLGTRGPYWGWAGALLLAVAVHLLWCAIWRSLGLAARHHPRLLDAMPEKGNPAAMLVSIGAALAIAQVIWAIAIPRVLGSLAS